MSGVCGVVRLDGGPVDAAELVAMTSAAAHRGRDGGGRLLLDHAGFAWQALRVTPEDVGDAQPVRLGDLVVVADARLDDRAGLRRSLGAGAPPVDAADSVLIAAAWQRWGDRAPQRLLGDFAVVVYDVARRVLHAFRDPMGMRPLHYRVEPGRRVLVGSEVKQVLAASDVPVRIFEPAVAAHLAGPFVPPTSTFYEGVEALGPGEALRVDAEGRVRRRVWWSLDPEERIVYPQLGDYAEHFRELLLTAVADRMRSVGPVGVLLSGGVDSGSVAASAGWLREQGRAPQTDLRTISWGFEELAGCDERAWSERTCRRYGLPSTVVWGDEGYPLAGTEGRTPDQDDPYLHTYQALMASTVRTAGETGVRLLLTGMGGDEVAGDRVTDELGLLKAGRPVAALTDLRARGGRTLVRQARRGAISAARRGRGGDGHPAPVTAPHWLDAGFAARAGLDGTLAAAWAAPAWRDRARAARVATIRSWSHQRAVAWQERWWTRHGLAHAAPFQDVRLARFAAAVPQWRMQRWTDRKSLARAAMAGVLPDPVRQGPSDNEFAALYERGMRDRAVGVVEDLLDDPELARRGWVDAAGLRTEYRGYLAGAVGHHPPWWALSAELWLRRWWR
jgi:asparagine synthase (glutamine-hydrolysing)